MKKEPLVRSVCRAILILQAINRAGSLSLSEIADAVGLPYATTIRIVQTLVHEGLIEREKTRKFYRVTRLVQSLSLGFKETGSLVNIAHPHLSALTKKIGWPVAVSTRVGKSMVTRDSTHAETTLTFTNYQPGYTFPVLESSTGHCFLAHLPDDERMSILKGIELSDGRSQQLQAFQSIRTIETIREKGYAVYVRSMYTTTPGKTSSISVPIFAHGKVCASLPLTIFASAMPLEKAINSFIGEMKATAHAIGTSLTEETLGGTEL